ncbi:MAG: SDR family NAD(P)-dependent oxidoreductase [Pseudomonadota bacterium]|nr:SDR family NAD(P)-dependent oxidoreductase [Pseudomonadota bacterium]
MEDDPRETRSELLQPAERVVMLSGASRGIGAALARRLLADGFRLSLGVRRPADARAKFGELGAERLLVCRFDAFDAASAQSWLDQTLEHFGRLDALINNAGMTKPLSFAEGGEDALDDLWAVNVKAPFRLIRLALPHLSQSGNGRIVNVASTDAKRYRDGTVSIAYAMTKHAVLALTHAAKFAGWEHGVRVTALCPGAVDTDFTAGIPGVTPAANRMAPTTLAEIVSLLLRLPNNASVAELVVNTRLESTL